MGAFFAGYVIGSILTALGIMFFMGANSDKRN